MRDAAPVLDRRRAGVLLHPTSLPSGELGADACRFVDFLVEAGFTVWQVLPLGPTHEDLSPYQCLSTHAGSERLISLERLVEWGWLEQNVNDREEALRTARTRLSAEAQAEYRAFRTAHAHWLDDYALYRALRVQHSGAAWWEWPAALRDRNTAALKKARVQLAEAIEQRRFAQFVFFRQWHALREYANARGVKLFGDLPIFVAHDSAEVWAQREYFAIDTEGKLLTVAGVPPDYFSETGQRWGNPHYDWERMRSDEFAWWRGRLATQVELYDLLRIDHFRGFEAYWEIPVTEQTAVKGHWVKAPGAELFETLHREFDPLPLVAEDLGVITPEVDELRLNFGLPGMKILQFAFDGGPTNPYLPHNHEQNCVAYTGTHDNNTTVGWYAELTAEQRERVMDYLDGSNESMPWPLIRAALASVARLAIIPMQDLLALDAQHRMNLPGKTDGNWRWRFEWGQVPEGLSGKLKKMTQTYGRNDF